MFANGIAANPPSELRKTSQQFFFFLRTKSLLVLTSPKSLMGAFKILMYVCFRVCMLQRAKLNVLFVISLSVAVLTKI